MYQVPMVDTYRYCSVSSTSNFLMDRVQNEGLKQAALISVVGLLAMTTQSLPPAAARPLAYYSDIRESTACEPRRGRSARAQC